MFLSGGNSRPRLKQPAHPGLNWFPPSWGGSFGEADCFIYWTLCLGTRLFSDSVCSRPFGLMMRLWPWCSSCKSSRDEDGVCLRHNHTVHSKDAVCFILFMWCTSHRRRSTSLLEEKEKQSVKLHIKVTAVLYFIHFLTSFSFWRRAVLPCPLGQICFQTVLCSRQDISVSH